MEIQPQDLGQGRQIALLRRRVTLSTSPAAPAVGSAAPVRRLGWLGRRWVQGTNLPPQVAAATLDAMRPTTNGFMGGFIGGSTGFWLPAVGLAFSGEPIVGAWVGLVGATMATAGFAMPGVWLRRLVRQPVAVGEIEALLAASEDALERAYLNLANEAQEQRIGIR